MSWWERIFRRRRLDDELGEELREHIEEKTEQLMRLENLSGTEARQAALRAFGNLALMETRSREVWQWRRAEQLLSDWKLTLRRLAKAPGFTVTVLLTLAIGIGANTAVFTVINSVCCGRCRIQRPGASSRCGSRLRAQRGSRASAAGFPSLHRWT